MSYKTSNIGNKTEYETLDPQTEVLCRNTGSTSAVSESEAILTGIALTIIIVLTMIGNILVALSVFTSRSLRIVQNFYIVSLAVADMTIALLVMPFSVVYIILGRWIFEKNLCKVWLTLDIMCCTSSILSICVIALDRYWYISKPIKHAQKRTKGRVLGFIAGVWLLSFAISSPPLFGWNDWPSEFNKQTPCRLTNDPGYVIYSAMGSFFLPLILMTIVYFKIYFAMRKRLRQRAFIDTLYPLALSVNTEASAKVADNNFSLAHFSTNFTSKLTALRGIMSGKSTGQRSQGKHISEDDMNTAVSLGMQLNHDSLNNDIPASDEPNSASPTYELDFLNTPTNNENGNGKTVEFQRFTYAAQLWRQKQKKMQAHERRAARTLTVIMSAFVICWLPFFLMYIIGPFCVACSPSEKVKNFLTWLGYINSSLNPIIYTIFNVDYRKAFKRLLGFG